MKKLNSKGVIIIETVIVIVILSISFLALYNYYESINKKNNNVDANIVSNTYLAYQIYKVINDNNISGNYKVIEGNNVLVYENLNIERIYYIKAPYNNILNQNNLLNFDGSTINYMLNIVNQKDFNNSMDTLIVKVIDNNIASFSYYQYTI